MTGTHFALRNMLAGLRRGDDAGATMVEYALVVGAIAFVVVLGAGVFGDELSAIFEDFADNF